MNYRLEYASGESVSATSKKVALYIANKGGVDKILCYQTKDSPKKVAWTKEDGWVLGRRGRKPINDHNRIKVTVYLRRDVMQKLIDSDDQAPIGQVIEDILHAHTVLM